MANQRESLYDLGKEGEKVAIKGKLVYSSLREKTKPRREDRYNNDPRYSIVIVDPEVVSGGDTELGKHVLDADIAHGSYESKSGKNAGHVMWSADSFSQYAPDIYTKTTGDEHIPAPDFLENELATGQEVTVLFSLYRSKKYDRISGSFDGVVIASPTDVKYLGTGGTDYSDMLGNNKATDSMASHMKPATKPAANNDDSQSTDTAATTTAAEAAENIFD